MVTVLVNRNIPAAVDAVRDDEGRVWHRADDGRFHTLDGRQHRSPAELRTDLIEVDSNDGSDGKTAELGVAV